MDEAIILLLAGFSTRIREDTAVSALMLLLGFLLILCSTLTTLLVARAEGLLVYNIRVTDLASTLQTYPSWDKNSSFSDAFHQGNSDEPFWGYWAQAPLTLKEDRHQRG